MKKILVIDDERQIRILLQRVLEQAKFEVLLAANGDEGAKTQKLDPSDLVITDLIMPGKEGIELIQDFKKKYPNTPIIAMSGGGIADAEGYLTMAKMMGAAAVIEKPVRKKTLLETVNGVLSQKTNGTG